MTKKDAVSVGKVALLLTAAERKLLLSLTSLPSEYEAVIGTGPATNPVMLTIDELDGLGCYVSFEVEHCGDRQKQKKLIGILDKLKVLFAEHADQDEVIGQESKSIEDISERVAKIEKWAVEVIALAEQVGITDRPVEKLSLAPVHREFLSMLPGPSLDIKDRLEKKDATFTVEEVVFMTIALAKILPKQIDSDSQRGVLLLAQHLINQVGAAFQGPTEPTTVRRKKAKSKVAPAALFQFKITLLDIKPAIWRRIQVSDCTLADLHDHIQAAFGWWNYHLHQFEIGGRLFGPPPEDDYDDMDMEDESGLLLSQLLPKTGKRTRWIYVYDFGDGWRHEVLFEGNLPVDPKAKYPLCLEGERACPPEDCGGTWGYVDYLAAIADPTNEQHEEMLEWRGPFDPEAFDPKKATKEMRKAR